MSAPSSIMDSIATTMRTKLGANVLEVSASDRPYGLEGKDKIVVKSPGVLVFPLGAAPPGQDYDANELDAMFCAIMLTRSIQSGVPAGLVAFNLATLIYSIVAGNELWGSAGVLKRAWKIALVNENTLSLQDKGVCIWSVRWTQRIKIDPAVVLAEFNRLATLHFTLAQGPYADNTAPENIVAAQLANNTPDIEAEVQFPEEP